MAFVWEVCQGDEKSWSSFDKGNPKTMSFVENRYAEYSEGGAPRRTVRLGGQDFKLDFSRMTMMKDGVISAMRRRSTQKPEESASSSTASPSNGARNRPGAPGDPLRGLSVHYLSTEFTRKVEGLGFTMKSSIRDIEPALIRSDMTAVKCPRTGKEGAAFVDVVDGDQNVGLATHMLSYTWGYEIGDIISTLTSWCARNSLDPKDVRIWMCCFCINQYRVIEAQQAGETMPFEVFRHEFESRVRGIGKVLALMGSWQMTLYTTRVWCVFELYTAMELQSQDSSKYSLEILMSPAEAELFRQTLIEGAGLDPIWKALTHIRVEKADSYVKQDRDRILELVRNGPGYARVNKEIVSHIHKWFAANSEGYLRERLSQNIQNTNSARACARVGDMLERVSRYAAARELLRLGREIFEATDSLETLEGAAFLRVDGTIYRRMGDLKTALELYEHAKSIHEKLHSTRSLEFASLLQDLGKLHGDFSNLDAELKCHTQAMAIRSEHNAVDTPEGAGLVRSLGMVYFQKYDYTTALDYFKKARAMHEETESLMTPEGAAALRSIGDVMSSMFPPKLQDSLKIHEQAHDISEQLGIDHSPSGVAQLRRIASLHKSLGAADLAKKWWNRAVSLVSALKGSGHTAPANKGALAAGLPPDSQVESQQSVELPSSDGVHMDKDWGVYFEVVLDEGYKDPEHRGFPHGLCSFRTAATVGIEAKHLRIAWGATDTLTVQGREWYLDGEALDQTTALQNLRKCVGDEDVKGYLSPLHAVNLTDDAKERAGIPASAKHFMFSYPVEMNSETAVSDLSDPDVAFLFNGGYVYLDEEITNIVRINAILPSSAGGLQFGPPLKWESQWSSRLLNADRFRPITIDSIRQSGATHFCWIRPNEVMWFGKAEGAPICPYGGFAYICRKGVERNVKRARSTGHSPRGGRAMKGKRCR